MLAGLLALGGCGGAPASGVATPFAGTVCSLLSAGELRGGLPQIPVADTAVEGTAGHVRSCRWGPALQLSVGEYQDLLAATGDSTGGNATVKDLDGLGTSAAGFQDSTRVVLYVQTPQGAFSVTASAYQGVTIEALIPLAKLVAGRI